MLFLEWVIMVWDRNFEEGAREWDLTELEEGNEDNERIGELPDSVDRGSMESEREWGTGMVMTISADKSMGVGMDELGGEITMTREG